MPILAIRQALFRASRRQLQATVAAVAGAESAPKLLKNTAFRRPVITFL
jgi:hypothetical protein